MPHQCTECGHTFPDGSKDMLGGCPDCGGNKFQFHKGEIPAESVPDESPPSRPGEGGHVASAVGKAADTLRGFVGGSAETPEPARDVRSGEVAADADDDDDGVETEQATLDAVTADAHGSREADANAADATATESGGRTRLGPEGEWPETARPPEHDDGDDEDIIEAEPSASVEPDAPTSDAVEGDGDADIADAGDLTDAETVTSDESFEDRAQADARSAVVDEDDLPPGAAEGDGEVVGEPSGERPDLAELREELNDQFESIKVVAPGRYELNLMELYDREEYIIAIQENGKYVIEVPDGWDDG
jgi:predicted  nucleic acid-binding Zn-ribbon protein